MNLLCSPKALLDAEGALTSVSCGAGPAAAETEWHRYLWGSQLDLMETVDSLSSSPPIRFGDHSPRSEACSAVTSPRGTGSALLLSSSDNREYESAEALPPVSP